MKIDGGSAKLINFQNCLSINKFGAIPVFIFPLNFIEQNF